MFWSGWLERRAEAKRDRQARDALMAYAPTPEQEAISSERLAEVAAMAHDHEAERHRRAALASAAEWDD